MPSTKPLIALRLPEEMYRKVIAMAEAESRSPANFIEHTLRRLLGPELVEPVFTPKQMRQIDIHEAIDAHDAIAATVEAGPKGRFDDPVRPVRRAVKRKTSAAAVKNGGLAKRKPRKK